MKTEGLPELAKSVFVQMADQKIKWEYTDQLVESQHAADDESGIMSECFDILHRAEEAAQRSNCEVILFPIPDKSTPLMERMVAVYDRIYR